MNTNKLKKFAQEARRKLLKQIDGQLEHILTEDTGGNVESRAKLQDEMKRMSREALVDKVAYTWFNRLVALRYMDARGYQPLEMAILTPQDGQVSPQILQEAMAGHIPGELKVNTQQVMDILDGRTSSSNPENEAYRRLLVASCNHLHAIFPFLFEAIDDYTELLLPDDLTSEFSIVQDVIDGMTDEDCQQVEILGWLYQFYISEKKDEVFASKGKVKKEEIPAATQLFTPRWIVEYMVQNTVGKLWVLNHPNSRLTEHMEYYIESELTAEDVLSIDKPEELTLLDQACGSGHILVYGFELLYKIYEEEGYAPSDIPRLIIEHNLHGFEIDERAAQLAGLAILMKAREYQRRLFRKSDVPEPKITCFEDLTLSDEEIKTTLKTSGGDYSDELLHDLQNMQQATNFGSLIVPHASLQEIQQAKTACKGVMDSADLFEKEKLEQLMFALDTLEKLGTKVSCVADNPPYMGSSKMNKELKNFVDVNYSDSSADLMACFIEAGLKNLKVDGLLSMINQHTWMFLSGYESLRNKIIVDLHIDSLLHLGPRTFPELSGEIVQNAAFVIKKKSEDLRSFFIRLVGYSSTYEKRDKALETVKQREGDELYKTEIKKFLEFPESQFGYWVSDQFRSTFKKFDPLKKDIDCIQGIITGNTKKFIRYWQEADFDKLLIDSEVFVDNKHWIAYTKGGTERKWFGNNEYVLNWKEKGNDLIRSRNTNSNYYLKPCVTWTLISSNFTCRKCPAGFLWDVSGSIGITENEERLNTTLGLLCSKISDYTLKVLNPTLNTNIENVEAIPLLKDDEANQVLNNIIDGCVSISKKDWDVREKSWDFQQNELIRFNKEGGIDTLEDAYEHYRQFWTNKFFQLHQNEEELNRQFIEIYGLEDELTPEVPLGEITILQEELDGKHLKKLEKQWRGNSKSQISNSNGLKPDLPFKDKEVFAQFISYAVGCMFGRYSLDKEGLILANQGETLSDYLNKVYGEVPEPVEGFLPDDDNIIPVLDDEWFEDDIVFRFHEFLKASFGEANFQQNLAFVEEQLGYDIRKYFDKHFYKDHISRYNKRPIYWKFSSPKGHFNVLIYMHRYTEDTLNNILNNYLREFVNKLKTRKEQMQHLENTGTASERAQATKQIDKLNDMIADCQTYEREVLMPLAADRISMDLDDGVLVNYNLFGKAVETILGVNDPKKKKTVKEFDWIDGGRIR